MKGRVIVTGILFSIILCFLSGCNGLEKTVEEEEAIIDFLKVGKADAICILYKNKTIVIDTGEEEDGAKVLSYLKRKNRKQIDELIITHFDKDHVGGADVILNGIKVNRVWQPNYTTDKQQYLEYKEALEKRNRKAEPVKRNTTLKIEDMNMTIFPSGVTDATKDNEQSLVITMEHKKNTFFFAGDAEGDRLKELAEMKFGHFDVLKVPHHGRKDSYFKKLYQCLQPKYAIITTADEGMSDKEVIKTMEKGNTKIYQTVNGMVHCESTKEGVKAEQE